MSLTKVWRDFTSKKVRTFLVIMSIAVGVMAIATVFGARDALLPQMKAGYMTTNPADISIAADEISAEAIADLKALPNIVDAQGELGLLIRWQVDGKWQSMWLEATESVTDRQIRKTPLTEGSAPGNGEIVLEHLTTEVANVTIGEDIVIEASGEQQSVTLTGFVYDPSQPSPTLTGTTLGYINLDTAEMLFGSSAFNRLRLKVNDETKIEAIVADVESYLASQNIPAIVRGRDLSFFPGGEDLDAVLGIMGGIGVLALLLSGFLVINTITTILAAEVPQIGTMKAIGATRWSVTRAYLMLILGYGIAGTSIGLLLGVAGLNLLINFISKLGNIKLSGIVVPLLALALGLFVGIIVPLLAAILPVWLATGVTVREAMVSYGLGGKLGRIDLVLAGLTALPFNIALSLRNVFRSKGRTSLTLITLTLAGATFIAVQATSHSLDKTLDSFLDTYDADINYRVGIQAPREQILSIIDGEAGIDVVEAWLNTGVEMGEDRLSLNGIPISTELYAHQKALLDGRWLNSSDTNHVVIAEKLAAENDYNVGDHFTFQIGSVAHNWEIVGIVRDISNSGNQIFASYDEVATLLSADDQASMVVIRLEDRSSESVAKMLDRINESAAEKGFQTQVAAYADMAAQRAEIFQMLIAFLLAMVVLVTIVGALGLIGTLTINVTERIKEVGVMRAVGASSQSVVQVFWLEGVLLGIVSWLISAIIGYPIARAFTNILSTELGLPVEFTLPPITLLYLCVGLLIVTSVSGVFPALSAARTRVSDIIRYA